MQSGGASDTNTAKSLIASLAACLAEFSEEARHPDEIAQSSDVTPDNIEHLIKELKYCLLYTSPSPRD